MQVKTLRGLTVTEYAALKQAIKTLPFPVTVRRHTQQYALGMVDIRATKATQYILTEENISTLRAFCAAQHLDDRLGAISLQEQWHFSCYRQGINYLGITA